MVVLEKTGHVGQSDGIIRSSPIVLPLVKVGAVPPTQLDPTVGTVLVPPDQVYVIG